MNVEELLLNFSTKLLRKSWFTYLEDIMLKLLRTVFSA